MPKGIPNAIAEEELGPKFFARVRAFDLACPRCDAVFQVNVTAAGRRGAGRLSNSCWDPRLSRFRCFYCGLRLTLGIIAYTSVGGVGPDEGTREELSHRGGGRRSPPADTVPTPRQALELRRNGVWALGKIGTQGRKIRVNKVFGDIPIPGDGVDPETLPPVDPADAPTLPETKPRGWTLTKEARALRKAAAVEAEKKTG